MKPSRDLDQFFTRSDVARECFARAMENLSGGPGDYLWVEPSAGGGAFLDCLPFPRVALDIDPKRSDISRCDFLDWSPGYTSRPVVVIGNPPFGKNASLARRFFDHSAQFASHICFVVPRTFQKSGFVNRLDRHMHLAAEWELAQDSFEFDGQSYAVPTVFQIWEKRAALRPIAQRKLIHDHFNFTHPGEADFAFQRVGARAGLVSYEGLKRSPQSHYFIRSKLIGDNLFQRLSQIDWSGIKARTAGNPSIGKAELIETYEAAFA